MITEQMAVDPFISLTIPEHRSLTSVSLYLFPLFKMLPTFDSSLLCSGHMELVSPSSVATVECGGEVRTFTATEIP